MKLAISLLTAAHLCLLAFAIVGLGDVGDVSAAALSLAFVAWNAVPISISYLIARRTSRPEVRAGMLAAQIGLTLFFACMVYDAFYVHLDAQSGLLFLFLPLYGSAGVLLFGLLASLVARLRRRSVIQSP